jgi:hypothetical protein
MRWLSLLCLLLLPACQSTPQRGLRLLAQADVEREVWNAPRTRFTPGEVPVVEASGFDGQNIEAVLLSGRGEVLGSERFEVPKQRHELRDAGISLEPSIHGFGGMRAREQKRLVTHRTRMLLPLRGLRPGEYEVRVQDASGGSASQRFSVVAR